MILKYFKQFFVFFEDYKKAFIKYSVLSICAAFFELFGVALTYPFVIKLLSNTDNNTQITTIIIGLLIVGMFLMKNLFMIFYVHIQADFLGRFETAIKKRIMNFFLCSDFQKSSHIPFAEKSKVFNLLIPNIINNFILRLLNLNINVLIFALITACITIKFPLAMLAALLCGILMIAIQNKIYQPFLNKVAEKLSEVSLANTQSFNEAALNIKEIKISNNENYFYQKYSKSSENYYNINKKMSFLTQTPPYIVEPFAILLLFVLLFVISCQNYSSPEKLVASFALIATAIFRLTPAISRIQTQLNGINSTLPIVKEFIDFYSEFEIKKLPEAQAKSFENFEKNLEIKNVSFSYDKEKDILKNINLTISKGEFLGIAGLSGVGKTTLADLIAGLYKPDSGEILFDGDAGKTIKIGYIPQEFSLISGTIRENIAFGADEINDEKVIEALKKAQLYEFIKTNYAQGIYANPFVDSNGFSLGQRQRIAIARALYKNPDLIILDEATSSLDLKTEDEICAVLNELKGEKTIIAIAHRLSTIKSADRILFLEDGEISGVGSFEELINVSNGFKNLVEIYEGKK